ncbi:MAG: RidA family protein [Candidatus Sungbacteria bacterium]|nr:RidA family protein [Candidatus Sungbacteria bacterium]
MQYILTDKAPKPGCYSQAVAVKCGDHTHLYLSGQTGNVPGVEGEPVIDGGVGPQTTQTLKNILAVVRAAGGDVHDIVELKVFLKDSNGGGYKQLQELGRKWSRETFGAAYEEFFKQYARSSAFGNLPARTTVWVPEVPLEFPTENTLVEITAKAVIPNIVRHTAAF